MTTGSGAAPEVRAFLARDVYAEWKRRVQRAESSIVVYTPYFDRMLERLLSNSDLPNSEVAVITDLRPGENSGVYRGQLLAARALLRRGVQVAVLARLHAKVLVTDDLLCTVGSQNFTTYGRGSREATVASQADIGDSDFAETLARWRDEAVDIDEDFVERLLEELEEPTAQVRAAQLALESAYDALWEQHENERAQPAYAEVLDLLTRSRGDRVARSFVWARLQDVPSGEWGDQVATLLADSTSNLTKWPTVGGHGEPHIRKLTRLQMYPLIRRESGRMGFARVGETRITFVRSRVTDRVIRSGGEVFLVDVFFPKDDLDRRNMVLTVRPRHGLVKWTIEFEIRFDGREAKVVNSAAVVPPTQPGRPPSGAQQAEARRHEERLQTPHVLRQLVRDALTPFKFKELGIENSNASSFFGRGWKQIRMVEFDDGAVLVVEKA